MRTRLMRFFPAVVIIVLFVMIAGYKSSIFDRYYSYRAPLLAKSQDVGITHFRDIDYAIKSALALNLSAREQSILKGMAFAVRFADDEKNFRAIFPYFLLLMHEMTNSEERENQKEIATKIIRKSLARAQKLLPQIYADTDEQRWQLIASFHILHQYPEFEPAFFAFYDERFGRYSRTSDANLAWFHQALSQKKYRDLGTPIIKTSFLHYYLAKEPEPKIKLPENHFVTYLKALEQFDYGTHDVNHDDFIEAGMFATHVVLVLTNYGEIPLADSVNARKAQNYIEATLDDVYYELAYLDLLAEYVQCLKIFTTKNKRIEELDRFLLDIQREDGSWGTARDFAAPPYDAFHPTWAALTAINQSMRPPKR